MNSLPFLENLCSINRLAEDDFNVICDDFFDLPSEDDDTCEQDWFSKFKNLEPPPMDMFSSVLKQSTSSQDLSCIKSNNPYKSLVPVDASLSKLIQSLSPVSVLESSDGYSSAVKGIRSKRKRPTTPRFSRYIVPCEPKKFDSSSYDSFEQQHDKKKRKIDLIGMEEASNSYEIVRKCSHCETTETPQWREGPNGPKTLCNACGVRFKSGRLLPEYRPASSPTFIPSLHSNSHRKIIAMRRKVGDQLVMSRP